MEEAYLALLKKIMVQGVTKKDRTGVGTKSIFGAEMRFDLTESFPLMTTKRVFFRGIVHELLWFLSGNTNIRYLQENGIKIWDEWADEDLNLGPVYGAQWRHWPTEDGAVDQIADLITSLKTDPDSRRHIVSAWNVSQLKNMALPPCHMLFQFYVANGKLSCKLTQRSADIFLGVPFNIASYALLVYMVAQQCGYVPGEFIWSGGDVHAYQNHLEQIEVQLDRKPYPLPTLKILDCPKDIFSYRYEMFSLQNYQCHPTIKAPIAV